jgi:tetratricopeptide (TPR) repeat protein
MGRVHLIGVALLAAGIAACASHRTPPAVVSAPKYPGFTKPDVPAGLAIPPGLRQRYDDAWLRFQAGDLRGADRDFSEILKQSPGFYPAEVALGDAALADREFKDALGYFTSAVSKNDRYLPALEGRVAAALAAGDDLVAASALEQLLKVDPAREEARTRLDMIRLRVTQAQLTAASKARAAGRLDEAQAILEGALQASPSSPVMLRELAAVEAARGALEPAEQHARQAIDLDSSDAESLAILGGVLDAREKTSEAADVFGRAVTIDPRPAWREKRDALRARAAFEALPAEYRGIPAEPTVTRAQVAAMIGIDLDAIVRRASRRPAVVLTDVRAHWAAPWILAVTQAGIMYGFPNHTFQPNAVVRRSDLAQVVSQLLNVIAASRPEEAATWRAERPRLDDVPAGHVSYRAIALAVAAGVVKPDETGRFWPGRAASGADLVAAVARIKQLSGALHLAGHASPAEATSRVE